MKVRFINGKYPRVFTDGKVYEVIELLPVQSDPEYFFYRIANDFGKVRVWNPEYFEVVEE